MTIAGADLRKAIAAAWDGSGLNALFQSYWPADRPPAQFPVLHDQEASPGQPYPYCVLDQTTSGTTDRMSGGVNALREVKDVTMRFNIYAQSDSGLGKSADEMAADLMEEVTKVFGGHPTVAATGAIALDNGKFLIATLENDFGIRIGEEEYQWALVYKFKVDVPVAV